MHAAVPFYSLPHGYPHANLGEEQMRSKAIA